MAGPATYYVDTLNHACDSHSPSGNGTLHFVGANVDSGSGFSGWLSHCDNVRATYDGCKNYLVNDHRAGFWDIALPYTGTTTPVCTANCYSNILFIPGMESSRLYMKDVFGNENQLWEPGALSLQQDAKGLYLEPDGTSINAVYTNAAGAVDTVLGWGDVYGSFLQKLASLKVNGTVSDYAVFPYDWRMSPTSVVEEGTPYNDGTHFLVPLVESLASSSKNGKVTIVAHSNGGLVTKTLMEKLQADGKADLVDKIIFVDVPQIGTPMAVSSLLHGDFQSIGWGDIGFVVSKANARALGEHMPDGFSLLPSRAYFAAVATPVVDLSHAPLLRSTAGFLGTMIQSAADLQAFMTGAGGRAKPSYFDTGAPDVLSSSLYDAASAGHASLDTWRPPNGVEVVQIAGWGLDTPSGIAYAERKEKFCFTPSACVPHTVLAHTHEFTVDGDGTVVSPSEVLTGTSPTYYIDLHAYNAKTGGSYSHGNITGSAPFQALFYALATSSEPSVLPAYVSTSVPALAPTERRLRIRLHAPYVPQSAVAANAALPHAPLVERGRLSQHELGRVRR